jgi:hypothetical protein
MHASKQFAESLSKLPMKWFKLPVNRAECGGKTLPKVDRVSAGAPPAIGQTIDELGTLSMLDRIRTFASVLACRYCILMLAILEALDCLLYPQRNSVGR